MDRKSGNRQRRVARSDSIGCRLSSAERRTFSQCHASAAFGKPLERHNHATGLATEACDMAVRLTDVHRLRRGSRELGKCVIQNVLNSARPLAREVTANSSPVALPKPKLTVAPPTPDRKRGKGCNCRGTAEQPF
ncbi:hypothetical protein ZHAS_00005178 [Anopheles sinensis]|uniref:Uncharacterized protein n=1 Tax=Anopheles sinensis TaxID=74873 RepID=A0A084VIR8_ANOSI|nr:hypothetical protein ZHAS_00005178 [Anopheles sinensis]